MAHELGAVERRDDLTFCLEALYGDLETGHPHARKASPENGENIPQSGPGGRTDDADVTGIRRQRSFSSLREQALAVELRLQLLERRAQRAFACGFDVVDDRLKLSPALVDGQSAAH